MTRIWVDVDNPPQAQYLTPIARHLRSLGAAVAITARSHPPTLEILRQRGENALAVGESFGASRVGKIRGTVDRTARLIAAHRGTPPDAVVATSRSGVLAARAMGCPSFTVLDYEGVELTSFRFSGTTILHPEVVPADRFAKRGFPAARLVSFPGLKEDLTFAGVDLDHGRPAVLPSPRRPELPAVLVRPPSETSHYRVDSSRKLLTALFDRLALRSDVQVVLSPREAKQADLLEGRSWAVAPVVLTQPIPFVPLLRSVSWVVTGGGTMLREAAWMGVPGVTVFQGVAPAVDLWLERQGIVRRISVEPDLDRIPWASPEAVTRIPQHPEAIDQVASTILTAARRRRVA